MIRLGLMVASISCLTAFCAPAADAEIHIATAGPMTGPIDWVGEQYLRGADMAVKDINARGGVLGQMVDLIVGDDFCEAKQAVALARKLVSDGVVFVAGHFCSHASIAAAKIYQEAGILQISPGSVATKVTEEGRPNVFRVCGRADRQGAQIANYLADKWAGKKIAVLDDGTTFGADIADGVRRRLHERGVQLTMDETYTPGEPSYFALVSKMQAAGIDVFFVGGLHREAGLMFRHAHDQGYDLQLVASSAFATGDFPTIAGPAIANTPMVAAAVPRQNPQAKDVVERLQAQGYEPLGFTLYAYAAVQVWAEAVALAGSLDLNAVIKSMHSRQFDTVLGQIGFDARGDVTGFEPWQWYVWRADGTYVPLQESITTKKGAKISPVWQPGRYGWPN